ncbi:hypothetical protein PLICRDRAFT_529252 [Plicaturopsis crispa FD-325 SS-3]|nr:hypothetical protein PLICRDRAFT_529252 [Plicaturopsis crispa FD-325 SS-3]
MRIPYVDTPVPTSTPEEAAIVARIEARRAPRPLQSLDLALLHAPAVADGWNAFLGAIRTRTSLAADVRELAICAVAVVNGANYEWDHHAPLAEEAGLTRDALDSLKRGETLGLNEKQAVVVEYAREMTANVKVADELFQKLKDLFTDKEVVELTATVAAYNCVSRFLVALDVGERNPA